MRIAHRRIMLWSTLGALVVAGLFYAFWPQPIPVDLGDVGRGPFEVTIEEEGETRVKEVYVVSAPLSGRLMRVETEVGDTVRAGETVVATIQPVQPELLDVRTRREAEAVVKAAEAARALAEAELERALAKLAFAESDFERANRLAERGNISERARDVAALEVRTAKAAAVSAKAALQVKAFELETARAALISPLGFGRAATPEEHCCIEVQAPVSGQVLRLIRESESVVSAADPILEIGDASDLEVIVDLLSEEAVQVEPGNPVRIEGWGGQTLPGHVRSIEPYGFTKVSALGIEEQRVNVIIDFDVPADRRLRLGHGYRVDLAIVVWQGEEVLTVPASALFRRGDVWAVFVEIEGRASLRTITLGQRNDFAAEVVEGLAAGERVVLHPSDRVADAVRIVQRKNDAR